MNYNDTKERKLYEIKSVLSCYKDEAFPKYN